MNEITLRQVCEKCGVTRRAVQGYEKYGLVHATGKTVRGYLLYDGEMQEKIKSIKDLQSFGFSVKEIADYQDMDSETKAEMLTKKHLELLETREMLEISISNIQKLINSIMKTH